MCILQLDPLSTTYSLSIRSPFFPLWSSEEAKTGLYPRNNLNSPPLSSSLQIWARTILDKFLRTNYYSFSFWKWDRHFITLVAL